jgi:hypothetical protein
MGADGGFEIVADTLDGHTRSLGDLTERLRGAADAAAQVSMPTDAYGIICQPFRMMLDPVEQWGLDALKGAVDSMTATAKGIKDTVEHYRAIEEAVAHSFKGSE